MPDSTATTFTVPLPIAAKRRFPSGLNATVVSYSVGMGKVTSGGTAPVSQTLTVLSFMQDAARNLPFLLHAGGAHGSALVTIEETTSPVFASQITIGPLSVVEASRLPSALQAMEP